MPRSRVDAAAARIDQLLAAGLRRHGLDPTPIVDDATFVRRAYLQVTGRIPSLTETEGFLADTGKDKRARLIDRLLDSPGYTSHESNFWFDLLRVRSRNRQVSGEPFAHWIRESIRTGVPYDEFVHAMLVASGPAHEEGNGATGYLLRDANMPHDAMANTLRLFLGTRVECAQCHNHPFDKWKQRDFYGMAAFFGGLTYRSAVDRRLTRELRSAFADADDRTKAAARRILLQYTAGLSGDGTGRERLPKDYQYDDARPGTAVAAKTIFGDDVKLPAQQQRGRGRDQRPQPGVESRRVFARWLTDADNPRFARTIVNRLWSRTFGRALSEPIDDLRDDTAAVHPALEEYLCRLLVALDFDLRQFERVLYSTRLFQQRTLATDPPLETPYAFQAPLLRRMSAEQVWDSLLTLVFADVDQRLRPTDQRAREIYDRQTQLTTELDVDSPEALAAAVEGMARLGDPARIRARRAEMRAQQQAEQQERQEEIRTVRRQMVQARRRGDTAEAARLQEQLHDLGVPRPGERAVRGREGQMLRASDLEQPSRPGHVLRQFGQSDRETVDAATLAASVPQALTLLNGPAASGDSSLRLALRQAPDAAAKVRVAFLALLSREPRPHETALWQDEIARDEQTALQDLVWVLCNSNEFRFLP